MDTVETFEGMDLRAAAEYYKYMYENSNASHAETVGTMQAALARVQAAEGEVQRLRDILALTPIHDKVLVVHETYQDSDGQCPHCRCDSDEPHKEACPVFSLSSYVDSLG